MRKKLITMGLVSALGASTSAIAIDLDSATAKPQVYASDAVVATDLQADGKVKLFNGFNAIETTALNVGISSGQKRFIRVDLGNGAEFSDLGVQAFGTDYTFLSTETTVTAGTLTSNGGNGTTGNTKTAILATASNTVKTASGATVLTQTYTFKFPTDCVSTGTITTTTIAKTASGATSVSSVSVCKATAQIDQATAIGRTAGADLAFFTKSGSAAATGTSNTIANAEIALGGAAGEDFVIFEVTAGAAGSPQSTEVSFTPEVAVSGSSTVTMGVYETLTQANDQVGVLYSASGTFVTAAAALSSDANVANEVANVTGGFVSFTGATPSDGTLGDIAWDLLTGALDPTDATAVTIGDIILPATSTVTLTGDVSFGDWYLDATACAGAPGDVDLVEAADGLSAAPAAAGLAGLSVAHTVCVEVDGTETIAAGSYSVEFDFAPVASAVNPAEDTSDTIGAISRNGTVVNIPYMTTFAEYNQRLILVNRSTSDADYSITFRTEADTTATGGTAATGTIPAGEVLSLKASDIVTLAGKTRTAATVTVVAPQTAIGVATNQVNLDDGSTDTVVYN